MFIWKKSLMWCPTACRTGALIIFIDRLLFIFIHKNENKCLHVHSQFLKLKNNPCLMDGILSTVENEPMNPPILFWFTVTLITGNQFPKTIQNYYGFLNCHCWAEVKEPGSMNYKIMFLLWQFSLKYNTKVLLSLVWVDVSSTQRGYYSFIYQKHNKEQNNKSIKKSK